MTTAPQDVPSDNAGDQPGDAPEAPKKKLSRTARVLLVLGVNLGVLLFTTEVVLRVLRPAPFAEAELMPTFLKNQQNMRAQAHPYQAFIPRPDWQSPPESDKQTSHNRHGFRGPDVAVEKPDDVFRIVCLGGSSTYGHTPTSDATTWPAQLQRMLNEGQDAKRVQVLNGGFSGYNTFESLANLSFRMLDFEPDLVIVYHSINDARCTLYRGIDGAERDNTHWRAVYPVYMPTPTERLLEKSMTYLIYRRYFTDYIAGMGDMGQWGIVDFDPDEVNPWVHNKTTQQGFDNFRRNLESIWAVTSTRDIDLVLASQGCDRTEHSITKLQARALDENEKILREVAEDKQLLFVEGRAALDEAAAREGKDKIYTHEVHLHDRGAEVLAGAFAEAILASGAIR